MSVKQVIRFIIFVVCVSALCQAASPLQCRSSSPVKFVLSSRRNQTGHWITQIHLDHGANHPGDDRWVVSVQQDTHRGSEEVSILATVTGPTSLPSAPPGYDLIPSQGYYKFHTTPMSWDEGRKLCAQEGAHLAVINSQEEAAVLKELFNRHPDIPDTQNSFSVAIGFHDRFKEGEYLTLFGESLAKAGYEKWSTFNNQPDNSGGNENCGSMHRDGDLNDIGCETRIPFICEFQAYVQVQAPITSPQN